MLQENSPLILIYLNFKGLAQIIRHLLCYLNIAFVDVLLDCVEEQKKILPKIIFDTLKGLKIDKNMLPILVHEGLVIEQLMPVITYICLRFERQDLLGMDHFQKARVQELLKVLDSRLPHTHGLLFELAEAVSDLEEQLIFPTLQSYFKEILRTSGYMKEFCDLLIKESKREFILGRATVVDFFFVESTSYMVGMFSCLDKDLAKGVWKSKAEQYGKKVRGMRYLRFMHTFRHFMKSQAYYQIYKGYLEGFPLLGCMVSPNKVKGMNRIWIH